MPGKRNNDVYRRISENLKIPPEAVEFSYRCFWRFIKSTILKIDLTKDYTKEEFKELRTCFNIPSLGKLACTYERYLNKRKYKEILKERFNDKHKESETPVHKDSDNHEQV